MTKQTNQRDEVLYSLEASVLGAIFLDSGTLAQLPTLEIADFQHPKHRLVFTAMRNLEAPNQPIDPVTVEAELVHREYLSVTPADLGELVAVAGYERSDLAWSACPADQKPQNWLLPLFRSRLSRTQPATPVRRSRSNVHVNPSLPTVQQKYSASSVGSIVPTG